RAFWQFRRLDANVCDFKAIRLDEITVGEAQQPDAREREHDALQIDLPTRRRSEITRAAQDEPDERERREQIDCGDRDEEEIEHKASMQTGPRANSSV